MIRSILVIAGLIVTAAAALLVLVWLLQRQLVYFPYGVPPVPEHAGLAHAEEVRLETADGLTLGAWWVPADGDGRNPAVLVFPGNAGNREHRAPLATALSELGYGVLLVDYRGYGGNPGRPSQAGLLTDAAAAWRHVTERPDVDPGRVASYGESLGSGVAAGLALEHPPAALVLRSPFTSLGDVGAVHYPWLPVRRLVRDNFPVTEWIEAYDGAVLVIAGDADTIIPVSQSRAVAEAADAELIIVPGADHNDPALLDGEDLVDAVARFLADVLG